MNLMKSFVLVAALVAVSFPAFACRGTAEYPDVSAKIDQTLETSSLSAEEKAKIKENFSFGRTMHEAAHHDRNMSQMKKSLGILDGVKATLSKVKR